MGSNATLNRRTFMARASLLSAAACLGWNRTAAADPPPEVTKVRLVKTPAICLAPEYIAEDLLRLEGFTDIQYVERDNNDAYPMLAEERADFTVATAPDLLPAVDAGYAITALAAIHGGCYELFGHEHVRSIRDLRGKRVAITSRRAVEYFYIASMLAYVGVDPRKDVEWVDGKSFDGTMQQFVEGKADVFLAFPPQPQRLRAAKVGHVIVNTSQDRPWNNYFCCMTAARSQFVKAYPVASKRVVRAILKAADLCAREPERAARLIVAKGYEPSYEVSLNVVRSLSYSRWRTDNVDDSLRFFGVRLHEAGLIKGDPNKLIAQGTDWRFLNELKRELKV
jgi:NitT/TauT family transport system substrate-binding protein